MRTDVTVDTETKLRCPQIPLFSPGRPASVGRGDFVEWTIGSIDFRGRVIGVVEDPHDFKKFLCVAMQMLNGACCERWVEPELVYDTRSSSDAYDQKASWLYGSQFLYTKPDMARQCFELTVDEMAKG